MAGAASGAPRRGHRQVFRFAGQGVWRCSAPRRTGNVEAASARHGARGYAKSGSLSDDASSTAVPAAWAKNRGAVVKYDPIFSSIAAIFFLTPPKPRDELHSPTGC